MPEFKLVEISEDEPRAWTTKDGKQMLSFEVRFEGDQGAGFADVNKLASSKPPEVGEVYDELKPSSQGRKATLKKAWQPQNSGQRSFGESNPERQRSIVRQHSQEMAIRWITLLNARGKVPEDADWDWVRQQIDWFQKDAES